MGLQPIPPLLQSLRNLFIKNSAFPLYWQHIQHLQTPGSSPRVQPPHTWAHSWLELLPGGRWVGTTFLHLHHWTPWVSGYSNFKINLTSIHSSSRETSVSKGNRTEGRRECSIPHLLRAAVVPVTLPSARPAPRQPSTLLGGTDEHTTRFAPRARTEWLTFKEQYSPWVYLQGKEIHPAVLQYSGKDQFAVRDEREHCQDEASPTAGCTGPDVGPRGGPHLLLGVRRFWYQTWGGWTDLI